MFPQIELLPSIETIVMPKIHSADDLSMVARRITDSIHAIWGSPSQDLKPLGIVASIESARSLFNIGHIASWQSPSGQYGGKLRALLVRLLLRLRSFGDLRTDAEDSLRQKIVRRLAFV